MTNVVPTARHPSECTFQRESSGRCSRPLPPGVYSQSSIFIIPGARASLPQARVPGGPASRSHDRAIAGSQPRREHREGTLGRESLCASRCLPHAVRIVGARSFGEPESSGSRSMTSCPRGPVGNPNCCPEQLLLRRSVAETEGKEKNAPSQLFSCLGTRRSLSVRRSVVRARLADTLTQPAGIEETNETGKIMKNRDGVGNNNFFFTFLIFFYLVDKNRSSMKSDWLDKFQQNSVAMCSSILHSCTIPEQ